MTPNAASWLIATTLVPVPGMSPASVQIPASGRQNFRLGSSSNNTGGAIALQTGDRHHPELRGVQTGVGAPLGDVR